MATAQKKTLSDQEKKAANSAKKIARFQKLGVKRMTNTLKQIDRVGALADRRSYTYSDEQSAKIVAALETAVASVRARFENAGKVAASGFTL